MYLEWKDRGGFDWYENITVGCFYLSICYVFLLVLLHLHLFYNSEYFVCLFFPALSVLTILIISTMKSTTVFPLEVRQVGPREKSMP